jgi:ABC-type Fe3+-hydroxamate transport system substrate-binding protein
MKKAAIYGIIAAAVVAAGVGIGVSVWSVNTVEPAVANEQLPSSSDSNEPIIVNHAGGTTEITETPERIVLLAPSYFSEPFLIYGIEPIGGADLEITRDTWYPELSRWTETVEVGGGEMPNLEAIAQLEPDLIIDSAWPAQGGGYYEDLNDIAPTLAMYQRAGFRPVQDDGGPSLSALENVKMNFMTISDVLGRHDEGVAALEGMDAKFNDAEKRLDAAGMKGEKVILAMIWGWEGQSFIRVHAGEKSLTGQIVEEIGLQNVVTASSFENEEVKKEFEDFGEIVVDLEGLAALDSLGAHLLIIESTAFDDAMSDFEDNPVWNNLSFVKEGRVHNLGAVNAVGAGPIKLPEFADRIVDEMTTSN